MKSPIFGWEKEINDKFFKNVSFDNELGFNLFFLVL